MKSTIQKMSHISKTTHAIYMKCSLNVIHDMWTQKMQKGKHLFFPHLDPFSQSWSHSYNKWLWHKLKQYRITDSWNDSGI
jgi:hypothetical protein